MRSGYVLIDVPAGTRVPVWDMQRADKVVIGGRIVKNRDGPVGHLERKDGKMGFDPKTEYGVVKGWATGHLIAAIVIAAIAGFALHAILFH